MGSGRILTIPEAYYITEKNKTGRNYPHLWQPHSPKYLDAFTGRKWW